MRISFRALQFIDHPLNRGRSLSALARFVRWQVASRAWRGPIAVPFIQGTRLLLKQGMKGATGNIYCGLQEFEEMGFVLHALRPQDLFIDVGANVGSYSVLAAGACGAEVVAFEPDPDTYAALLDNIHLNQLAGKVDVRNSALGSERRVVNFSSRLGATNHVLTEQQSSPVDSTEVQLTTLDEALGGSVPFLMKVDVEGYETEVIRGATSILDRNSLQGLLIELNGHGSRYGFDETALQEEILSHGFTPCRYDPFERILSPRVGFQGLSKSGNRLYIRNVELLQERVLTAQRYAVLGKEL